MTYDMLAAFCIQMGYFTPSTRLRTLFRHGKPCTKRLGLDYKSHEVRISST